MEVDEKRTVLAFVRGETGWDGLARLGLVRSAGETEVQIAIPANFPVVRPTIADVAAGLISQQGTQRQEWASVLLAINVDLADLEHDQRGAALLEAIWDAARGQVSDTALSTARAILTGSAMQN